MSDSQPQAEANRPNTEINPTETEEDTNLRSGKEQETEVQFGIEITELPAGIIEDTEVKPGTGENTDQPETEQEITVQPGIDEDTKVQPGTDEDTKVQPGIDEDTKVQPGIDEDTKVQPEIDEDIKIQPGRDKDNQLQAGIEEETKVQSEIPPKDTKVQAGKVRDRELQPSIAQDTNPQPDIEADTDLQQGIQGGQGQDARQHSLADPDTTDDSSSGTKAVGPSSSHTDVHTEPEAESGRQGAAEVDSNMTTGKAPVVHSGTERNGEGGNGDPGIKRQDNNPYCDEGPRCGARHVLVLWAFLGFANLFIQRVAMSIALVAMASQNASQPTTPVLNSSAEPCGEDPSSSQLREDSHAKAEFHWSNTLQGFILSAFFYGYFSTQIPSSFLTGRIGGKRMFVFGVGGCSVLAALTPLCARLHPGALVANRVLQGCVQGVVFPAMQTLLSVWVPAKERSRLVATTYAGCQAGTVIGTLGAGYLCDSSLGWPVVFYIEGALGFLWCLGWMAFTFDSPAVHPRISDEERFYLRRTVDNHHRKTPKIPCKSIMTSPALYAIAAAHFGNDWGCFAVMTCLPKFMKDILNYDLSSNGFLSSLPYLVMWATNLVAGALADFLRKPNRMKTVHVRKLMVFIGLVGPASLLLASAYYPGCSRTPMVVLLTLAMGLSGFTIAGHSVNHLDIAPVFAGLLFAMTNSFGTTTGWIGPALAGALTEQNDTRERWQMFFLVSGAVYAVGGSIYILLARGDTQPWAQVDDSETEVIIPAHNYMSTQAQDNPALEEGGKMKGEGNQFFAPRCGGEGICP